ncbi:unnamed protein product [Chrysoparadoxa australica]
MSPSRRMEQHLSSQARPLPERRRATGSSGVGYYSESLATVNSDVPKKRGLGEGEGEPASKRSKEVDEMELEDLDEETIKRMLDEADEADVKEIDAAGLKHLLLALEKKITKNQQLRVKYPEMPEKFLDSELDLDESIKGLAVVATAPALYPQLVEHGAVHSLLGLLTHENTDISIATVGVLQDLCSVDSLSETEEAMELVNSLVENQGLELLVQNLARLDEAQEEDAKGVYATLGVMEGLLEVRGSDGSELHCGMLKPEAFNPSSLTCFAPLICSHPQAKPSLGPVLCEKTGFLKLLLKRVKIKAFDDNKLYASEVLSILVNMDTGIQKMLGDVGGGVDGVDMLLRAAAVYRRAKPTLPEEEECVENIFDSLAAALLVPENQTRFREGEGLELMIRCLREKSYAAGCAIKVLNYALTDAAANCERFVTAGGLKAIFPVFMGRAAARRVRKRTKSKGERSELEEHCASIVTSLAMKLEDDDPETQVRSRFLAKFLEDEGGKVDRMMELFEEHAQREDQRVLQLGPGGETRNKEPDEEEDSDEEEFPNTKMSHTLQRLSALVAVVAASSAFCRKRVAEKFHQHGRDIGNLRFALLGYIDSLGEGDGAKQQIRRLMPLVPQPQMSSTKTSKEETGGQDETNKNE